MGATIVIFLLAYRFYGRFVARMAGLDPGRPTPAVVHHDGVDFVPTSPLVLFGHHFASIAAAGPIIGPTLAAMYGFLPAWLWMVVGVIFIGAVHDFTSLFLAVREGGRSVAEVAKTTLGNTGFFFYLAFAILLCILVSAAFVNLAAVSLTALYPIQALGLPADQTLLHTVTVNGRVLGRLGGIASTSAIAITAFAPLLGWLLYDRHLSGFVATLAATAFCGLSVWLGFLWPITLHPKVWMAIILTYSLFAGWFTVKYLLQPRDFTNVQLLYAGILAMVVGLLGSGLRGVTVDLPMTNIAQAEAVPALGWMWPILFVTIACGSVSGAHGLICGGTSCKQVASEKHLPLIGYGAMILESLLGVCVLLVLAGGLGFEEYRRMVWPTQGQGMAPVAFAVAVGNTLWKGLHLPPVYGTVFGLVLLEGFLVTTIDTVIRLSRYLLEELWQTLFPPHLPLLLRSRLWNTFLVIAVVALLAFTNGYSVIWPIFGSANQLLAALTLLAGAIWLIRAGRPHGFVTLPAAFMMATTLTALGLLLPRYIQQGRWPLVVTNLALIGLALGVVGLSLRHVLHHSSRPSAAA